MADGLGVFMQSQSMSPVPGNLTELNERGVEQLVITIAVRIIKMYFILN